MKRFLMHVRMICVLLTIFSTICLAEEEHEILQSGDYTYYINDDGTVTIAGWGGEDETLAIPAEIDGMKVTVIGENTFSSCHSLASVKIPGSVMEIRDGAFDYCEQLTLIVERDSYAANYCEENGLICTYSDANGYEENDSSDTSEEWTCLKCGSVVQGNFCNICGAEKPSIEWICPNCGETVSSNFCNRCGTAREDGSSVEDIAYQNETIPPSFPDDAFSSYIFSNFDMDRNGILTDEECSNVTEIIVDEMGVGSVEGIQHFPHLETLMCDGNGLSSINVSGNPELRILTFNNNSIESVDLSNNPMLAELYCQNNLLTSLDLSGNPHLGFLECRGNNLTSLDLTHNPELQMLRTDLGKNAISR